jgi:1-deoxy-D-xylulose-5-phosphate synthase
MLVTAFTVDGPVSIRYPRGAGFGVELTTPTPLPVGKAEVLEEGDSGLIVAVGSRVRDALAAVEQLRKKDGKHFTLLNLRFIKPLDETTIMEHLKPGKLLVVIEEGSRSGGIGEAIASLALSAGWQGPFAHMAMPDAFPEHGTQKEILRDLEIDATAIVKRLRELTRS